MPRPGMQENKEERRAAYKAWLEENPETHRYWPTATEDGKKTICQALVSKMKNERLIAKSTGWRDVRSLPGLLDELHGIEHPKE
jgi:hypothetical protein